MAFMMLESVIKMAITLGVLCVVSILITMLTPKLKLTRSGEWDGFLGFLTFLVAWVILCYIIGISTDTSRDPLLRSSSFHVRVLIGYIVLSDVLFPFEIAAVVILVVIGIIRSACGLNR